MDYEKQAREFLDTIKITDDIRNTIDQLFREGCESGMICKPENIETNPERIPSTAEYQVSLMMQSNMQETQIKNWIFDTIRKSILNDAEIDGDTAEVLDGLVYDAKCNEARSINNEGSSAQIEWLVQNGFSAETIRQGMKHLNNSPEYPNSP